MKLKQDKQISNFAFSFELCHYVKEKKAPKRKPDSQRKHIAIGPAIGGVVIDNEHSNDVV